jgi:hypothetical protein
MQKNAEKNNFQYEVCIGTFSRITLYISFMYCMIHEKKPLTKILKIGVEK